MGVAIVAFALRLLPVLFGGGLFGLGNYDDAVYYSAAVGLVHGRLPYRDFLLLHPPGIMLALAPFAALGRLFGDATGFAIARVGWMLLGALNAVLVTRVLRRFGLLAATVGGLFYATFRPAIFSEHLTLLEAPATTLMLVALLLLSTGKPHTWLVVGAAGTALGISAGMKIWGAFPVLLAVGWLAIAEGGRRALTLLAGAVAGATLICLPFFAAAPHAMIRMVILDQLGRPGTGLQTANRLAAIFGQYGGAGQNPTPLLIISMVACVGVTVAAFKVPAARLACILLVGCFGLLLVTPSFFRHYPALIAGPAAVTVGAGVGQLVDRVRLRRHWKEIAVGAGALAGVAGVVAVAAYGAPVASFTANQPFPGSAMAAVVASTPGCVTADDPTTLIESNSLGRNLERGCQLVIDLGGRFYDDRTPSGVSRAGDRSFQKYALAYLATGRIAIVTRYWVPIGATVGSGFSPATMARLRRWPIVARVGKYALRRPSGSLSR